MAISVYTPPSDRLLHNTEVDFGERWSLGTAINLMQYDKTLPIIAVSLYSGGQPYTIPSSADLNVRVGKSDGTKVYNPVLGCNSTRNVAYIEVTRQISAVYGPALATLELIIEGNIAHSSYILLDVAKNPAPDDAIESTNEYKSLFEAINDAKDAIGKPPIIQNGTWWLWNSEKKAYDNTDFPARGETGLQGKQGEKGATGNGIASTILNNDYTLTIQFTDGTSYTTPSIRGKIGPTGSRGPQGLTGETGATGNGIASTILNDDFTLTVHFTDGTSYTTPSIRGATGPQGKQGEKGETGSGFKVLGYYATESALSAAVTNPAAGDAYGIGTSDPYDIYIWDGVNHEWVNNGVLQGAQGIQGEPGVPGIQGPAGKDGKTPVKGTDYFTQADKQEIAEDAAALVDLSGKQNKIMASGILQGDGNGNISAAETMQTSAVPIPVGIIKGANGNLAQAEAGTDYMAPVAVTSADNGKFLRVVNGAWAAAAIDNANGGSF